MSSSSRISSSRISKILIELVVGVVELVK
jgi:hypothetical protein